MRIPTAAILPRNILHPRKRSARAAIPSSLVLEAAVGDAAAVFERLKTSPDGLTESEAVRRLEQRGPNTIARSERRGRWLLFSKAWLNPLVGSDIICRNGLLKD